MSREHLMAANTKRSAENLAEDDPFVLITGNSNPDLANGIGAALRSKGVLQGAVQHPVGRFPDGEPAIEIQENLRGREVFIIQPTCPPDVPRAFMDLLLMMDATRRASAEKIYPVLAYAGGSRQDRKDKGRVPISSSILFKTLEMAGASHILTLDIHSDQQEGFVLIPWDKLSASRVLVPALQELDIVDPMVVSPDAGGAARASKYSNLIGARREIAVISKRRSRNNDIEEMFLSGDVKGADTIIADDILDTGGTLIKAANLLVEKGARSVRAAITHGLFSVKNGVDPVELIENSPLAKVFITDSVPLREEARQSSKIEVVTVTDLLAEAIRRIYHREPISPLIP